MASRPGSMRLSARVSVLVALPILLLTAGGCAGQGSGGDADADAAGDGAAGDESAAASPAADSASAWQDRLMAALNGEDAWERARYLHFDWIVDRGQGRRLVRTHSWDRYTGRYRVAFEQGEDGRFVALFDLNEVRRDSLVGKVPAGEAWVGGKQLTGAARDSALHRAYAIFVNDSYWLLMPYKWEDPGVHTSWEGRTELSDGRAYPTIHLTFEEDLGVTTDQYWAFLDPETHRMAAWRYHLEGQDEKGDVIRWQGWKEVGPIELATDRVWPDGSRNLYFENLEVSTTVPDGAFTREGA